MENWKILEKEVFDYLKFLLGSKVRIINLGGSNSNAPDIVINNNENNKSLNIEVKSKNSQAGQFVINKRNNRFVFGERNKSNASNAGKFIDFLNSNFSNFTNVGKSGIKLNVDKDLNYNWVIDYYKSQKNIHYIATSIDSKIIFFKPEKLPTFFDIESNLRTKKSGSRDIPLSINITDLKNFIEKFIANNKINSKILNLTKDASKTFLATSNKNLLIGKSFNFNGNQLYFSDNGDSDLICLKVLSKTDNMNVIFSIFQKSDCLQNINDYKSTISF
jgi:Holliday junction resolvase